MKKENGITMIALVITIIVMVILAGAAITMVVGDDAVIRKSKSSVAEQNLAQAQEEVKTAWADLEMGFWMDTSTTKRSDYFTAANLEIALAGKGTISELNYVPGGTTTGKYVKDGVEYEFTLDTTNHTDVTADSFGTTSGGYGEGATGGASGGSSSTITYTVTDMSGNTYVESYVGKGTKTLRSNAALSKFQEVKVNDTTLATSNYSVKTTEDATIVEFTESYLKSLAVGSYSVKIVSSDGYASANIKIFDTYTLNVAELNGCDDPEIYVFAPGVEVPTYTMTWYGTTKAYYVMEDYGGSLSKLPAMDGYYSISAYGEYEIPQGATIFIGDAVDDWAYLQVDDITGLTPIESGYFDFSYDTLNEFVYGYGGLLYKITGDAYLPYLEDA